MSTTDQPALVPHKPAPVVRQLTKTERRHDRLMTQRDLYDRFTQFRTNVDVNPDYRYVSRLDRG